MGTWVTTSTGAQDFVYATGATDYIEFDAIGKNLVIYRIIAGGSQTLDVCINAVCSTMTNSNSSTVTNAAWIVNLTGGTDTVQIIGDFVFLDQFMILAEAGGSSFPTPTPQPSSTPAFTATPQPTSTPAFTATPQPTSTPMATAIDIGVYATLTDGQVTRFEYSATAASVHIANLLTLLFLSMWAFFFIGVFIVSRGNKTP